MIRLEHLPADVLDPSPIARAALSGKLPASLLAVPRSVAAFPTPEDRMEPEARAEIASALEAGLAPLEPHVAVPDAARALARPGTFAVVTGQQPGFVCAPLYSLYKALQAVKLARQLSQHWERPVVALFWNHADDSDIAEVHHTWVLNANLDAQKIALGGLSSGRQPLSRIVLDAERQRLGPIREALRHVFGKAPHVEHALDALFPRPGETMARAFTRGMTNLLGRHGLVVLEPDWIREPISRQLTQLVTLDPGKRLTEGAQRVRDAGFDVAIDPADAALLFAVDAEGRRALRAGGDGFRFDGESGSRTGAELAAEIVQDPAGWSPGALLRPIAQDLALPVAAYVGGMGELAYHAQLGPLRDAAGAPRTPFVARVSCTLVDGGTRASLDRLEAGVGDVIAARGTFAPPADDAPEPAVLAKLRAAAQRAHDDLDTLRSELAALDPGLAIQLKRTGDSVRNLIDTVAEKAERVHRNKSGKGRRHERRANSVIFPGAKPQERVLGPLQFVARHGEEWIDELLDELDPLGVEHVVVHLADTNAEEEAE